MMKNWWKGLRFWQKGAIIGILVGIIINIGLFIHNISEINQLVLFLPREITNKIFGCLLCPNGIMHIYISIFIQNIIQFIFIGLIIGIIIDKINSR